MSGANHVVFPEREAGQRVAHLVSGQMLDYMQVDADFALAEIRPPKELVGVPLGQTGIRSKYGITVVAVKPSGDQFSNAAADTELIHDDIILVTGRLKDLERFANLP